MKTIVDSNILIDFLNANPQAVSELLSADELAVSVISYIEVMSGVSDFEVQANIKLFFAQFEILEVNNQIANEAIKIRMQKKMKLPDALILATSIVHEARLLTRDEGFSQYPNVKIPYKL